jgi:enamine deaminase RidA (YjgF/YER057c/UK114 family)
MNRIEGKLFALGYELPDTAPAMALYSPVVIHSGLAYVSGQLPRDGDRVVVTGAVGRDVSIAEAEESAKLALLRGLAALKESLGSLDRIQRVLKLSVYIQSAPAFTEQSRVADGASKFLYDLFGPNGSHARTAVGVAQLPKNASVEIDLIVVIES